MGMRCQLWMEDNVDQMEAVKFLDVYGSDFIRSVLSTKRLLIFCIMSSNLQHAALNHVNIFFQPASSLLSCRSEVCDNLGQISSM